MNQNDYVILFDEKGTPYIAHAGWLDNARNVARNAANAVGNAAQQVANRAKGVGRGVRTNHKYILKVNENGRTRYFYKPEEVKAYYEAKRKGIKNPAEYAQKAADAASNAVDAVKNAASKAADTARNAVREATGQAARDRMDEADSQYAALDKAQNEKYDSYKKAQDERKYADYKTLNATIDQKIAEDKAQNANFFNRKQRETEAEIARNQQQQYQAISNQKKAAEDKAKKELDTAIDAYNKNAGEYYDNKRMYDNSLAGAVDRTAARARDVASDAREAASSAFNKAKDAANNTVNNAKNAYERMKSEFRELTGQAARDRMDERANRRDQAAMEHKNIREQRAEQKQQVEDLIKERESLDKDFYEAYNRLSKESRSNNPFDRQKRVQAAQDEVNKAYDRVIAKNDEINRESDKFHELEEKRKQTLDKAMNADLDYQASKKVYENSLAGRVDRTAANAREAAKNTISSAQDMIDKARTAVKDKSEDISAKAKSTAQSARDSVKGMIDNARSSTAKAVNEAWDKIPKNVDGTVNPFDPKFQSTYNNWKNRKDKYDNSLTGRAKEAAEKATDSVMDMIDQAKKVAKNTAASAQNAAKSAADSAQNMINQTKKAVKGNSGSKASYSEYSDNDKDFAEKNYSKKNHVEDTDFYTFKRDDGKWVILEEDMKWVLPEGVTGNDPGVRNALKQFADHASAAKAIGNENYNTDQWVDAVTEAIDNAAEKQKKKK